MVLGTSSSSTSGVYSSGSMSSPATEQCVRSVTDGCPQAMRSMLSAGTHYVDRQQDIYSSAAGHMVPLSSPPHSANEASQVRLTVDSGSN